MAEVVESTINYDIDEDAHARVSELAYRHRVDLEQKAEKYAMARQGEKVITLDDVEAASRDLRGGNRELSQ